MKQITTLSVALTGGVALAWCVAINAQVAQPNTSAQSAPGAQNSSELEEVVVTAERRSADVQKIAASVEVRGGDELRQQGKFETSQILEDVPGVSLMSSLGGLTGGGVTNDNVGVGIVIRGATPSNESTFDAITAVPTTAVYVDGVLEGIGGDYDVDRVEILKGPQGTLYGRSATAGVVSTYTRDPVLNKFSADVTAEYGSYDLRHDTAVVNLPLGDTFALRLAGNEYERDGYYVLKDAGAVENTEGKAKLLYKPSDDLSVLLGWAVQNNHFENGGYDFIIPSIAAPNKVAPSFLPEALGTSTFREYYGNVNWNVGFATLTYLPALRTWNDNNPGAIVGPGGATVVSRDLAPLDQHVTQELRLASNGDSKLRWLLGGFYYDNRLNNFNIIGWQSSGAILNQSNTRKETRDWGVFGEATYPFTDTLRLTGGLRYDKTYVDTDEVFDQNLNAFNNGPGHPNTGLPEIISTLVIQGDAGVHRFDNTTYKARLEKDLSSENLVYASVATGFVPGDVQVLMESKPTAVPFDEETLTAYEVGSKNRFFNNTLQVNGDIYYYDYTGFQQLVQVGAFVPPQFALINTPARMKGLELESIYQLTANDRLGLNYAWINAVAVDRPAEYLAAVAQNRIVQVAPVTANAFYDHTFRIAGGSSLLFHGDVRYASSHDQATVTPAEVGPELPFAQVPGEFVWDLTSGWTSPAGKYSVTAYLRNVGDSTYKTQIAITGIGQAPQAQLSDPRTWGVIVHASF
jgi:outer membrane receptor protein involved in Fe transport